MNATNGRDTSVRSFDSTTRPRTARHGWFSGVVLPLVLVAVTIVVLRPVLDNGFVNWGDNADLVENDGYRGFGPHNLLSMFKFRMGHFQPLAWLTFAIDHAFWGMNPRGYHLSSLLWHAAAVVAAYFLIRRLVRLGLDGPGSVERPGAAWIAALAALVFALHPLRVEAIAWATERRGPLSGVFFFLSILFYLRHAERAAELGDFVRVPRQFDRRVSILFFFCSLMAKEFGFTLPLILLILDMYPLRRIRGLAGWLRPQARPIWREKLPFFALMAVWVLIAVAASKQSNVAVSLDDYGPLQRVAQAFFALVFYVGKTGWPTGLSPLYSIPVRLDPFEARYVLSAVAVVVGTVAVLLLRRRLPALLTTWVVCAVLVAPVLGLAQTGRQFAADRYTYLPAVAVSALVCGAIMHASSRVADAAVRRVDLVAATVVLLAVSAMLGRASAAQVRVWKDSMALWQHAISANPQCPVAHHNLAVVFGEAQRYSEAVEEFRRALELNPKYVEALCNWGVMLAMQGWTYQAEEKFEAALRLDPQDATAKDALERVRAQRRGHY